MRATILCLLSFVAVRAQPIPDALLFNRFSLSEAGAAASCSDGSPISYFYRNCTANHDRKPGDPTDYCAVPVVDWVVVFLDGEDASFGGTPGPAGPYCYDARSCFGRSSNLTGSSWLPATAFSGGMLSPFPEENPNLYKAYNVLVPSCTSDLFLGTNATLSPSFRFCGKAAVTAVLRDLFSGAPRPQMASADRVFLVGGAGVMSRIDELADVLLALKRAALGNASAELAVFGLCDGCLLQTPSPPFASKGPSCTTDANCPPLVGLPALAQVAALERPPWCSEADVYACFLAPALRAYLVGAARTPVLLQAAQFDARQLASFGASPLVGAALAWAEEVFAPAVVAAESNATWAFSAACAAPSAYTTSGAYYSTLVRHTDEYNHTRNESLSTAWGSFLEDAGAGGFGPEAFGTYVDTCATVGCNEHCSGGSNVSLARSTFVRSGRGG